MHLRNFPRYFIKDGERRAVYYSAEARDLRSLGWEEEVAVKPEPKPELDLQAEPEAKDAEPDEAPDLTGLTRAELLQYAMDRGVDLPNNASKAQLLEACENL